VNWCQFSKQKELPTFLGHTYTVPHPLWWWTFLEPVLSCSYSVELKEREKQCSPSLTINCPLPSILLSARCFVFSIPAYNSFLLRTSEQHKPFYCEKNCLYWSPIHTNTLHCQSQSFHFFLLGSPAQCSCRYPFVSLASLFFHFR